MSKVQIPVAVSENTEKLAEQLKTHDCAKEKPNNPVECIQEVVGRTTEETPQGITHYTHYRIGRHPGDVIQVAMRQQKLSNDHGP